jgi:hypothetical protein
LVAQEAGEVRRVSWNPAPGEHTIRSRATDDQGNTQPDSVSWNELGYLHQSVLAHPVRVESPARVVAEEAGPAVESDALEAM